MNTVEITHKLDEILRLQVEQHEKLSDALESNHKLECLVAKIGDANSKLMLAQSIATRDLWMEIKAFHDKASTRHDEAREEASNINARLSLMLTEIEFLQLKLKS